MYELIVLRLVGAYVEWEVGAFEAGHILIQICDCVAAKGLEGGLEGGDDLVALVDSGFGEEGPHGQAQSLFLPHSRVLQELVHSVAVQFVEQVSVCGVHHEAQAQVLLSEVRH